MLMITKFITLHINFLSKPKKNKLSYYFTNSYNNNVVYINYYNL